MAQESILWQRLNAQGGVPSNIVEAAYNDAIGEGLLLIERHHEPLVGALREIAAGNDAASRIARAALFRTGERLLSSGPADWMTEPALEAAE